MPLPKSFNLRMDAAVAAVDAALTAAVDQRAMRHMVAEVAPAVHAATDFGINS